MWINSNTSPEVSVDVIKKNDENSRTKSLTSANKTIISNPTFKLDSYTGM